MVGGRSGYGSVHFCRGGMREVNRATLEACAREAGLHCLAVVPAEPLDLDAARLRAWQASGYAGAMAWMKRDAARQGDPRSLMPAAASVVVFAVGYSRAALPPAPPGSGRVARYAWGRDYHEELPRRVEQFTALLREQAGVEIMARVFSDAVPLLERALARAGGLGFTGRNTMIITPGRGSFFFLAEAILDVAITGSGPLPVLNGSCGTCRRCLDACPTRAFVDEYTLDARRCISYLTIEKRGHLTVAERRALGSWVFGCDVCQEVCPFNHAPLRRGGQGDLSAFEPEQGVGAHLTLEPLFALTSERLFRTRFTGTPLLRARRAGLLRNAAVVLANTGWVPAVQVLAQAAREDPSPVVRAHCLWAVCVLDRDYGAQSCLAAALVDAALRDPDESVQAEARSLVV